MGICEIFQIFRFFLITTIPLIVFTKGIEILYSDCIENQAYEMDRILSLKESVL